MIRSQGKAGTSGRTGVPRLDAARLRTARDQEILETLICGVREKGA